MSADLVTLAAVQEFLGGEDTTKEDHLVTWIHGLSAFIRRYIDQPVETTAYTETLNGTGETTIRLSYRPVVEVSEVTIDDDAVTLTDVLHYDHGELYLSTGFTAGRQNVVVKYTAGNGEDVPDDLKLACCLILEQASQAALLQQATRGDYAYVFAPTKWPKDAREIIDSYRRKL